MFSVIPEKHAALTTFGFTINLHFSANFLAHILASPANPPIEAPTPVGTINAPVFIHIIIAVSYTHLDVYKRQRFGSILDR